MKATSAILSFVVLAWGSAIASAQCPSCGSGSPRGIGKGEPLKKAAFDVVLKYFIKGVMVVRDEGDAVGLWINKSMVKTEQLEKLDGFKLERQPGD
jgi:hypothetical protein